MASIADQVRDMCRDHFEGDPCEVTNHASCSAGAKLEVLLVSAKFEGVPLIKRHRMVNSLLKEGGLMVDERIHALSLKTWTPDQWEKKMGQA